MKMQLTFAFLVTAAVLVPSLSGATSLSSRGPIPNESSDSPPKDATMVKREVVKKYVASCRKKPAKEANCDKLRKDAVEIAKESLHTLGSSAKRTYMPTILKFFKSDEVVLRIAAADAMGMIGLQDSDYDLVTPLTNDPVPDVRRAVGQMLQHGKGSALALLSKRTVPAKAGLTPETPPDPGKYAMPVAPGSTYLFYASDAASGRLSYATKGMNEAAAFFKGKAKRGPLRLEEFQEKYRDQLDDEKRARDQAQEEIGRQMNVPVDPANMQASMKKLEQVQAAMAIQTTMMINDMYSPDLFGAPTVYVLEERQIGKRGYPARYVVFYQDQALRRPGFRLCWMTASDQAIKLAQATSLMEQKQEEAQQKKESLPMVKEKSEQERKSFKQGQTELEKQLGF